MRGAAVFVLQPTSPPVAEHLLTLALLIDAAHAAGAARVLGDVRGRACLLVDDLASTGRTLAGAAEALRRAGAREVHAAFSHAVMAADARERLLSAPLGRIVTSDSIPVPEHPRIEVVR